MSRVNIFGVYLFVGKATQTQTKFKWKYWLGTIKQFKWNFFELVKITIKKLKLTKLNSEEIYKGKIQRVKTFDKLKFDIDPEICHNDKRRN